VVSAIRWRGVTYAREHFSTIRDLRPVRVRPPRFAVVNRCFLKYQKPREDKTSAANRSADYEAPIGYQSTVGFREYVYLHGDLEIAFAIDDATDVDDLVALAVRVNYFGKRGSLMQFVGFELVEELVGNYSAPFSSASSLKGVLQPLDDMAATLDFDQIDISTDVALRAADRPSVPTILPMNAGKRAAGFASYTRQK